MSRPSEAVRAFSAAISAICGRRVKIATGGVCRTDGKTVHVPESFAGERERDIAFGICCHEISHVYHDTVEQAHAPFVRRWTAREPAMAAVASACMNTVADFRDEVSFERVWPGSKRYFAAALDEDARRWIMAVEGTPGNTTLGWKAVLVGALLVARGKRLTDCQRRRQVQRLAASDPLVARCARLLRTAASAAEPGKARDDRTVAAMVLAAIGILDAIRDRVTPESTLPVALPVQLAMGGGPIGEYRAAFLAAAGCSGESGVGAASGSASATSHVAAVADVLPLESSRVTADAAAFLPFLRRYARLLLADYEPDTWYPATSGKRFGDPVRWRIDGRVFLRRGEDERRTGTEVAVLLDRSESMAQCLPTVAGAAAALGEALLDAGAHVEAFAFGSSVARVGVKGLYEVAVDGSTATHLALAEARSWLSGRSPGLRRVIVLLTDGVPDAPARCREQALAVRTCGIALLVGFIASPGVSTRRLVDDLPGGQLFEVRHGGELAGFRRAVQLVAGDG